MVGHHGHNQKKKKKHPHPPFFSRIQSKKNHEQGSGFRGVISFVPESLMCDPKEGSLGPTVFAGATCKRFKTGHFKKILTWTS